MACAITTRLPTRPRKMSLNSYLWCFDATVPQHITALHKCHQKAQLPYNTVSELWHWLLLYTMSKEQHGGGWMSGQEVRMSEIQISFTISKKTCLLRPWIKCINFWYYFNHYQTYYTKMWVNINKMTTSLCIHSCNETTFPKKLQRKQKKKHRTTTLPKCYM